MLSAAPSDTASVSRQKNKQPLRQYPQHEAHEKIGLTGCVHDLAHHVNKLEALLGISPETLSDSSTSYADLLRSLDKTRDPLDTSLSHWCTLIRCLPKMDPISQKYVRTVAMHAMHDLLEFKRPSPSTYAHPCRASMSYVEQRDDGLNESMRKKADGWIPTHYSSSPSCASATSASTALHPSFSSIVLNDTKIRHKRWFRRYHKVAPDTSAISNWIKEKRPLQDAKKSEE